ACCCATSTATARPTWSCAPSSTAGAGRRSTTPSRWRHCRRAWPSGRRLFPLTLSSQGDPTVTFLFRPRKPAQPRRCRPQVGALAERLLSSLPPVAPVATGLHPDSVAVGDFNGDGKPALAVANFNSNIVSIRLGNGDGTFTAEPDVPVGITP